jgi:hypothetical protein
MSRRRRRERLWRWGIGLVLVGIIGGVNIPTVATFAERTLHDIEVNSQGYKEAKGHWSVLSVPSRFQINAVHAALLYTGKVLIIAGSGNNIGFFKAGTFKSIVWDPRTDHFKQIHTPSDMFCGGHAFLPDGRLLIAGGTSRYEVLASQITHAAGVMQVRNNALGGGPVTLAAGTQFVAPSGLVYLTTKAAKIAPARAAIAADGTRTVTPGGAEVWVEAVTKGKRSVVQTGTRFSLAGAAISANEQRDLEGEATNLNLEQQNFWASKSSYLFNPATESYEKVQNLKIARWYPTLVPLADGRVLASSGLDQFGRIVNGDTEIYEPSARTWQPQPQLNRVLPTYPALFLTPSGKLFYTGSNAGYGSATVGRTPGIWDLADNSFKVVPGLDQQHATETSGSVLLPPAQAQKYMLIGGGGVGESPEATGRTAIADLNSPEPRYVPGPSLPQPTRYPEVVITPDNKVVIAGGSKAYRGKHASDLYECHSYDPATGKLTGLADPTVGRDYHSEALLLPDGRIVTLGGNPLYGDKEDTTPGYFEKRIEIYSPPYLYHGSRPTITGAPQDVSRGQTIHITTPDASAIKTVSLIRPSAYTHVTNLEQRSIELQGLATSDGLLVSIPTSPGLVPPGWYMLFVADGHGTPSQARWIHVA